MERVILFAVSPDRIGVIRDIADLVRKHNLNIVQCYCQVVESHVISFVEAEASDRNHLSGLFGELEEFRIKTGIALFDQRTTKPELPVRSFVMKNPLVSCPDKIGLLHEITSLIAKHGLSILEYSGKMTTPNNGFQQSISLLVRPDSDWGGFLREIPLLEKSGGWMLKNWEVLPKDHPV